MAANKTAAGHLRENTAKEWRSGSAATTKKANKKAGGPTRLGTAKDWRKGSKTSKPKKNSDKLRGGPSRG